jgi:hypothetical protein
MQMPASDDDREMMARFNDTFRKLKTNREQVPLEVLQTKYGKAYQKLTKEMADLADWFAARLRERMPFPMHPKDIAGNRQLSQQIAAVLAEESQPGALMDQYRKALIDDLDYDKFLDLQLCIPHERSLFLFSGPCPALNFFDQHGAASMNTGSSLSLGRAGLSAY